LKYTVPIPIQVFRRSKHHPQPIFHLR
jgi:hypothetical protein